MVWMRDDIFQLNFAIVRRLRLVSLGEVRLQTNRRTGLCGHGQPVVFLLVSFSLFTKILFAGNRNDRGSEDRTGMGSVARDRIQKVGENPLVDLEAGAGGQIHKADATLS